MIKNFGGTGDRYSFFIFEDQNEQKIYACGKK